MCGSIIDNWNKNTRQLSNIRGTARKNVLLSPPTCEFQNLFTNWNLNECVNRIRTSRLEYPKREKLKAIFKKSKEPSRSENDF